MLCGKRVVCLYINICCSRSRLTYTFYTYIGVTLGEIYNI